MSVTVRQESTYQMLLENIEQFGLTITMEDLECQGMSDFYLDESHVKVLKIKRKFH